MPHAGGYTPGAQFQLSAAPAAPLVTGGTTDEVSDVYLDSDRLTTTTTGATTGTQWKVSLEGFTRPPLGPVPDINFSSSDESIATVDALGDVTWVSDGDVEIIATAEATPYYPSRERRVSLTNTSISDATIETVEYEAHTFDPSKHLLVIYNTNAGVAPDSQTVAEYFRDNRPDFATANLLGIDIPPNPSYGWQYIDYATQWGPFTTAIRNWLAANPTKPIRYIVLSYKMPVRVAGYSNRASVQWLLTRLLYDTGDRVVDADPEHFYTHYYPGAELVGDSGGPVRPEPFTLARFPHTTALVTCFGLHSVADCEAYIDKVAAKHVAATIIEASYPTTRYVINDQRVATYQVFAFGALRRDLLLSLDPPATVDYSEVPDANHANVTGFLSWGWHATHVPGVSNLYALNGIYVFSGDSDWFIAQTFESYNGIPSHQGFIKDWFKATSFGGTAYECTPAGGVSHVDEPAGHGLNNSCYYQMWEEGYTFLEAAWASNGTYTQQVVGDPLIKK